jgi:hypothetical protein
MCKITMLPVCLALFKHITSRLVVKWVTISESLPLYILNALCSCISKVPIYYDVGVTMISVKAVGLPVAFHVSPLLSEWLM